MLKSTPQLSSFCLGATYNKLASPKNQAWWRFEDDIDYGFCKKEVCDSHILAGCQEALQSRGYIFHHNAVLKVIDHEMQIMIN